MSTLLLRLAAPMQAWGGGSKFTRRETQREPTKSGVVGLLAAALGRRREEPIADLAALRYGVRVDRPGTLLRDYHTAHTEDFWQGKGQAFVSERYYLGDAVFLVGLEGEAVTLQMLDAAIRSPVFPLYLGRRSCPPEGRVSLGVRDCGLLEALQNEPWLGGGRRVTRPPDVELVCDAENGAIVRDLPLSFSQTRRQYGFRGVLRTQTALPPEHDAFAVLDEHDAFAVLEEDA